MVKPNSNDLRQRVVRAVLAGDSCRVAADRFGISKSSGINWTRLFRRSGDVTPRQKCENYLEIDGYASIKT